jgi:hypothetical protein
MNLLFSLISLFDLFELITCEKIPSNYIVVWINLYANLHFRFYETEIYNINFIALEFENKITVAIDMTCNFKLNRVDLAISFIPFNQFIFGISRMSNGNLNEITRGIRSRYAKPLVVKNQRRP